MIKHIVMWTLNHASDAASFKAQLETCQNLVPGMGVFEVATKTATLPSSCDVVLYSEFESAAALNAYQVHPHHQAVAAALGLLRQSRVHMDYEA